MCYSCIQVCALLFGGPSSRFSCSTLSNSVNFLAYVDGYADSTHCSSNPVTQDFFPTRSTYTGPGAYSAYIQDHGCTSTNYCFSAPVPSSQPTNQPTGQPSSVPSSRPSIPTSQPSRQPSTIPSSQPSRQPSNKPSSQPSRQPTRQPSSVPSTQPVAIPTSQPSRRPSNQPSGAPSRIPTGRPSSQPSHRPSTQPTRVPTIQPSSEPSSLPSSQPTRKPTAQPSRQPSCSPSSQPTRKPTAQPSRQPSCSPSSQPTRKPTAQPSRQPSCSPSSQPTRKPTAQPSRQPSCSPSSQPTGVPSMQPSRQPSFSPSSQPSVLPTRQPSGQPSARPSGQPSSFPTNQPTGIPTSQPSGLPTTQPSDQPSEFPSSVPSGQPSSEPSSQPSACPSSLPSSRPSEFPSSQPTRQPSGFPSFFPSSQPSGLPSSQPSNQPSGFPSSFPTMIPSCQPSFTPSVQPTCFPSVQPSNKPSCPPSSVPTSQPTDLPSCQPTLQPSGRPSGFPSGQPSVFPTNQPTGFPTGQPSNRPSNQPIGFPTNQPSNFPSSCPSKQPTVIPSCQPSVRPTNQPTVVPSVQPTSLPTGQPTVLPTCLPTSQPSRYPSVQPVSSPSVCPSSQPTAIPSIQPVASPTSAPQATIYETNGVLFYLGATHAANSTRSSNSDLLGSSFILFGRNLNHQRKFPSTISLDSSLSHEFVSPITNGEAGIRSDVTIRSTTIVGDINGDGFLDLLVGYPLASKCSVYLGDGVNDFATIITTIGESFAIIGDPYQGGGFLGWSSIRVGDLNGDGIDEIMISAINANTIYVIYGRTKFDKILNVLTEVTNPQKGFRIQGRDQEINFGVSLTLVHGFRKGGRADIAVTAQRSTRGQCVVYILFGSVLFKEPGSLIAVDQIRNNSLACLRILTPLYSFAGFSLAGIGDINSDGYDDLAIGSVPYYRGSYVEQRTYILYGRVFNANELEFDLSEMGEKDGIIITGGGFLVTGVGDVNGDNVADVMISSYYDWQGQRSSYLIRSPANMTYSPSLQPSSSPTMPTNALSNSSQSSNHDNSTSSSAFAPSFRPAFVPSLFNASTLTRLPTRAIFTVGTARPSAGKPSLAPSLSPTFFHYLRGSSTENPSSVNTRMPTMNTTRVFTEIDCSSSKQEKEYCRGSKNGTHSLFRITADAGIVKIIGNEEEGAKNVYVLYCPKERVDVIIENFRKSSDVISVTHLSKEGYSYSSLDKISYASTSGQPLTLLFCANDRLRVIFPSHSSFDFQDENFLFEQEGRQQAVFGKKSIYKNTVLARVQIGVVFGVFFFLFLVFASLSYQNKREEKRRLKEQEKLLKLLRKEEDAPNEVEAVKPIPVVSSSYSGSSGSCSSSSSRSNSSVYRKVDEDSSVSTKSTFSVVHKGKKNTNETKTKSLQMNKPKNKKKDQPKNFKQNERSIEKNHRSSSSLRGNKTKKTFSRSGENKEDIISSVDFEDCEEDISFLSFSDAEDYGDQAISDRSVEEESINPSGHSSSEFSSHSFFPTELNSEDFSLFDVNSRA
jgi:hypothetical protein